MLSKLRGTIHNDALKELMVRNTYIYPPQKLLCRLTANVMGYALVRYKWGGKNRDNYDDGN